MDDNQLVARKAGFSQVCIWPGTLVGQGNVAAFEKFMEENFDGVRVQYLEEVKTFPDRDANDCCVPETGGRNDLLFAVHEDDIAKFAVARLAYGIRWIEDALAAANPNWPLYEARLAGYKTWYA